MSNFRRLMSLAVAFVMAVMVMIPTALASNLPEDVVGTEYEEAVELLNALKIMVGDDTGEFRLDDNIKRSEVAKIAVAIAGLTDVAESTKTQANFPDVGVDHWANGYINVAQAQQYVIGDDMGKFRPNDNITYAEAVTIMMRALGYEPAAKANGGFPTGYLVTAGTAGLFKGGVSAPTNAAATRGIVAKLAYNALTINLMERTGFGVNETYEVVDKTLLEDKLDVQKLSGQVVATSESTLSGASSLKDDQVQIKVNGETKTYFVNGTNVNEFLARNVIFYVRENANDDLELILVTNDKNKNEELSMSVDQIDKVTGSADKTLSYWKDKDNDKKSTNVTIAENATVFYNGVVAEYDISNITELTSGQVTLLDTDRDEKFNYVFITEFRNIIVDEVSLVSNRITDKFNLLTLTLDPEDTELSFAIYKDGKKVDIKEIKEWDVLSVAANAHTISEATVIKVYVSEEKVTGKITEIEEDTYKIGDKHYEVAANYVEANQPELKLGDEGTFYLDVEGKIAAVDTHTKAGSNYAYLVNAATSGTINTTVQFKLYNKKGETIVVDGADKMKINSTTNLKGEAVVDALEAANNGQVAQLITYDTNSNDEISYINTAAVNESEGTSLKSTFSLDYASENAKYSASAKKLAGFNVSESTLIFEIPAGSTDTEEYSIRDMSMFVDKSTYDVEIYDLSEDLTAGVIIVKNSTGVVNAESSIAVVNKIAEVTNDEGNTVHKLYALYNGEEVEINAKDTDTLIKGSNKVLETGDIIQFQKNSKGEIDKITLLFDSADRTNNEIEVMKEFEGTEMTTIIGTVTKKFANSMNIKANNMQEVNLDISGAKIYLYDASKVSRAQVKTVDSSYITKFDDADPEKVFVRMYKGVVTEVVIIKEV